MAAQILSGQGYEKVYNLKGGIKAWQGLTAVGPAEVGMALLTGKETPVEIIFMALGLEEGLRAFYDDMARKAGSPAVSELFERLAAIELKHKSKLLAALHNPRRIRCDQGIHRFAGHGGCHGGRIDG